MVPKGFTCTSLNCVLSFKLSILFYTFAHRVVDASSTSSTSNAPSTNHPRVGGGSNGASWILRLAQRLANLPLVGYGFKLLYYVVFVALTPFRYVVQSLTSSPSSRLADARNFAERFESKYGVHRPAWLQQPYKDSVALAHAADKYLLLYIHSPLHQDTDRFCRRTLCSEAFVSFASDNLLCWAGSIDTKEGYAVSGMLRATTYPFIAIVKADLVSNGRYQITILDRQEGKERMKHPIVR